MEITKYIERNKNRNKLPKFWDAEKVVLIENCIFINVYIKKKVIYKINNLIYKINNQIKNN